MGSAPSNGAAASKRTPIPGAPKPAGAYRYCFGFGAEGVGLTEKLQEVFPAQAGGSFTLTGCNTPNFSKAGVTRGKSLWEIDEEGHLMLGIHNGNGKPGHPRCQVGGTVPAENVDGVWHLCRWALPFVSGGKIVQRITHDQRHNEAKKRYRAKKK